MPANQATATRAARSPSTAAPAFSGDQAYEQLLAQMRLGPRPVASRGDRATGDYILAQLRQFGWPTETQEFVYNGLPIRDIIGKAGAGQGELTIVGAHYDTRPRADRDPQNPLAPMPGANDGASGTAVLLELARTLDRAHLKGQVWLAFFDGEDNGGFDSCVPLQAASTPSPGVECDRAIWPYSVGADYMAAQLTQAPAAVVVLDMIGDSDQNIYWEKESDPALEKRIWDVAAGLGYSKEFIPQAKYSIDDDHTPFLKRGLRAIDVIDFDYPYWHTTQDTADHCSPESLERVGRVIKAWLEGAS